MFLLKICIKCRVVLFLCTYWLYCTTVVKILTEEPPEEIHRHSHTFRTVQYGNSLTFSAKVGVISSMIQRGQWGQCAIQRWQRIDNRTMNCSNNDFFKWGILLNLTFVRKDSWVQLDCWRVMEFQLFWKNTTIHHIESCYLDRKIFKKHFMASRILHHVSLKYQ